MFLLSNSIAIFSVLLFMSASDYLLHRLLSLSVQADSSGMFGDGGVGGKGSRRKYIKK